MSEVIVVSAARVRDPIVIVESTGPGVEIVEPRQLEIVDIQLIRGPSGNSWQPQTFVQNTPEQTWVINHNLGYYPQVNVFDTGGQYIDCQVVMVSVNQMNLVFNVPMRGSARLI